MIIGDAPRRLYAYSGGKAFDPDRPRIVFLHGGQHDHSVWILQSRYLAHQGYAVMALDLPGHGRSDGPVPTSVEDHAERIAAALQSLAQVPLLLVGHSMGSLIALEVQRRLRGQVRGLALLGAAFPMRVSDALLTATREDPAVAMQMINVWSHSPALVPFQVRPCNPGPGFNIVWQNLRLMQRIERANGTQVLAADFAACNAYRGGLDAARGASCPILFLLGATDSMTPPKAARELIEACARAQVTTLARTGHSMMAENPDAVRVALRRFADAVLAEPAGTPSPPPAMVEA
jgi:pimeloyl-ACP methyl ester carboxylesterase